MPKSLLKQPAVGDILYQWYLVEYERHARGTLWYVLMLSAGLILVLFGLLSGNFLFVLIIILFAIILFLQAYQPAQDVQFAITDLGVVIGGRFYTYSEFESFYIIYEPPEVEMLYFETHSLVRPLLRVPLSDQNPVDIRHALRAYLSEDFEKEEEPLSDKFGRRWKIH